MMVKNIFTPPDQVKHRHPNHRVLNFFPGA